MFRHSHTRGSAPRIRNALWGALAIGLVAGALNFLLYPISHGADFAQFHYHARVWLSGRDPYSGGFPIMRATRVIPEPLFYPFPTLLAVAPFALIPLRFGGAAFIALSTAFLAFGLIRSSPERLPMLLGAGCFVAVGLGQWSLLVTAAILLPAMAWLMVLKPNIGVAATIALPSIIGAAGGAVLLLGTLALQPSWPHEWIRNLHSMPPHPAPISTTGGIIILAALLRWRRPEARLLFAMACVPQLMYFSDQLPLWLVPATRRESTLLTVSSLIGWLTSLELASRAGTQPAFNSTWIVLASTYVPALIMVLRRPNQGNVANSIEHRLGFLPEWLAGSNETDQELPS